MTIIEARELAIQGKTVISPYGQEWTKEDFEDIQAGNERDWRLTSKSVFGVWREKKEPRRVYAVELAGGSIQLDAYSTYEAARHNSVKGERIVEFVEKI